MGAIACVAPDYGGSWYATIPALILGGALALIIHFGE